MLIILHEFRTGAEFAIRPMDIVGFEVQGPRVMLAHVHPYQAPPITVKTTHGPQEVHAPLQNILLNTEVIETADEIQTMMLALDRWCTDKPVVSQLARSAAAIVRDSSASPSFGNGPRGEGGETS